MVYLTGDTHGELDRFKDGELRRAGKGDFVVVLGDFGFVWDGSKAEQKNLDWLRKRPYTILFLDGSHENYDLLEQYPTEERFGGLVQPLGGNVYHVCRGSVLELEGKKYLCFGGAESPDKEEREAHVNWWPQEMPSDEEYARFLAMYEQSGVYAKAVFVKARVFGAEFRVLKVDKTLVDYYTKLSSLHAQYRAVGVNYNQTVKELKSRFSEKKAMALLYKLEKMTVELAGLSRQILALTHEFQQRWLPKSV